MKNPFRTPTSKEVAQKQLEAARLDLLQAHVQREEWESRTNMLEQRIERLEILAGHVPVLSQLGME